MPVGMIGYELGLLESLFKTLNFSPMGIMSLTGFALFAIFNIPIAIFVGGAFVFVGFKTYSILKKYLRYLKSL